jgi:hypothetical protein
MITIAEKPLTLKEKVSLLKNSVDGVKCSYLDAMDDAIDKAIKGDINYSLSQDYVYQYNNIKECTQNRWSINEAVMAAFLDKNPHFFEIGHGSLFLHKKEG